MLLNTAPQNEAVLSNVGQVGEFRIRNSAKAFNILSSGLYANKIRAIVRELSTNAYDSHVDAGRATTPFDVHLPTQLEPWFAIRDYGTGLTFDQVTNIYTTYFESTKTNSNDFVGCLGLGSKSPFAYTDNFTVTAIKDGKKGIYTAFLNEHGVPSIAQMIEEPSDEPSGVEVKFAVNDRYDFDKFRHEASTVYSYFPLRPVVSGPANFSVTEVQYGSKDIVPGVHSRRNGRGNSNAIMGNIAYPIQVPNAETNLGPLVNLLNCGLDIFFDIGEVDFQASREGLSYIPQTIEAIKAKLTELNGALAGVLAKEAEAIDNLWDRALFLSSKYEDPLWTAAVRKYATDTKFELFAVSASSWDRLKTFEFTVAELAATYNVSIAGFSKYSRDIACSTFKPEVRYSSTQPNEPTWKIRISNEMYFVNNDTKVGAVERAKYHWRTSKDITTNRSSVYVVSPADKTKPADFDGFMLALINPPRQMKVSELLAKPKNTTRAKDVTILKLVDKNSGYYRRYNEPKVWRDAGKVDSFDSSRTYYYLPLSGYTLASEKYEYADTKAIDNAVFNCGLKLGVDVIYGVRKTDIEFIKTQKNWVNLEDHISMLLSKVDSATVAGIALRMYKDQHYSRIEVSDTLLSLVEDPKSPFIDAVKTFKNVSEVSYDHSLLQFLTNRYAKNSATCPLEVAKALAAKVASEFDRYPMLRLVSSMSGNAEIIADYINLVDKTV